MAPLFSFLTTAYRTECYVGETIVSVLAQTRTDWELIVVDNGNSDEMARVVQKYTSDPRIKLVRQENKGFRGGVTAAAHVAVGRYLCPLDSDDQLQPDFCERVGALIDADPGIDAVGCDTELVSDDGMPPQSYFEAMGRRSAPEPSRAVSLEEMLGQGGLPNYIGAFRRDVWDSHGAYDPGALDVESDVALWLGVAAAGHDIRILPDRLAKVSVRPDSLSRDSSGRDEFERRLEHTLLAVCSGDPVSEAAVSSSGMMRRLRYFFAMRRARWALLDGDVDSARAAAGDAYRYEHTLRAAAVIVALRISPEMLRSIHPTKNRAQDALRRARFRIARGRAR